MVGYVVKTEAFEGPLELLLSLIGEKKLHISRVSLAAVADQFLKHLETVEEMNKPLVANFIYIASALMFIKSVSLLPSLKLSREEEQSIAELEERLKLYQRVKELGRHISQKFGRHIIFFRESPSATIIFVPTAEITLANLLKVLKQLVVSLPQPEALPNVLMKKVRKLEEVIDGLIQRIRGAMRLNFKDVVRNQKEKINVILHFLGLLELAKRGIIKVEQEALFQDITLYNSQ